VRRLLIQYVLPLCFCLVPLLAAGLVAVAIPRDAMSFYLNHISTMDDLILGLGVILFVFQVILCWRALHWHGSRFNEWPDRWVTNLAQAAEWFPMLGLLGTVAGILQTFSAVHGSIQPEEIIQRYAPAMTATGSGLFMALINILPPWMVLLGRDLILTLGAGPLPPQEAP
jgi:MotA/TolQ/ExbB proton channel family